MSCLTERIQKQEFYKLESSKHNYTLNYYPRLFNGVCMARHDGSFVIDSSCNLFKCPWDIGKNDRIIGNISNSDIINRKLLLEYLIGDDHLTDEDCVKCFYLPICGGGCINLRLKKKKYINVDYCFFMKDYIDEYIKIYISYLKSKRI